MKTLHWSYINMETYNKKRTQSHEIKPGQESHIMLGNPLSLCVGHM